MTHPFSLKFTVEFFADFMSLKIDDIGNHLKAAGARTDFRS